MVGSGCGTSTETDAAGGQADDRVGVASSPPRPDLVTRGPSDSAGTDLSTVLIVPPGFQAIPGDALSGPIAVADVAQIFIDHPTDARIIVDHGFRGGYMRNWKRPPAPFSPGQMTEPPGTTLFTVVLHFDTAAHARDVLAHFRTQNRTDGYQFFTVSAALIDGYGVRGGPDSLGEMFFGVSWVAGPYLFNIMSRTTDPAASPAQVVELAGRQQDAVD